MGSNAASASYEKLAQDAMDGNVPRPTSICKVCSETGVPFSLNGPDGPRDADEWLGIPSNSKAATEAWFTGNPWIKDREQNFRDTFALQVVHKLGELKGEAFLAEMCAFLRAQEIELYCLDDEMETETYVTPMFLMEVARADNTGTATVSCGQTNFVFLNSRIYFWTFTTARWGESPTIGADGQRGPFNNFDWKISGQFDITRAAQALEKNFLSAKARHKAWIRFKGAAEVVLGVLSLIPVVAGARGLFGVYKGVRYTIAAIEASLAANAIGSGSMQLIKGEGVDFGEDLFASLGSLADPKDGAERGRQVFMFINLAMLTPAAYGGARWILRKVRGDIPVSAKLDVDAISEEERRRLAGHTSAEPLAIELHGSKPAASRNDETGHIEWRDRPSLDTNSSQIALTTATGKASYAVMSNTLRSRLTMLIIQHSGSLKVIGRVCKVVGDAGEEALAAMLVEKWGVNPERILGYSNKAGVPSRFGLTNKSGHGLDMMVWVPPPPSLTVRAPTSNTMRHSMDALNPAPTQTVTFTEDTLLILETKATLGGTKTPGFNKTQGTGTKKMIDLQKKIQSGRGGWSTKKMFEADPDFADKIEAIEDATANGRISYFHAQVFFDSNGNLNKLAGQSSGIQLNIW